MLLEWASEQNVHLVQAQLVPFLDIRNEKHPFLRALIWARAEHIIFLRIYTPSPHLISINHYHVRAHVWLFLYHVSPHWKRHIGLVLLSYLFGRLPFKMKCSSNTNFTMGLKTKHFEVCTIFWSLRYVVFCLLKTQVFSDLWNWRNWLLHDIPDICIFILDVFVLSETLFAIKLKSVAVTKHA